MSVNLSSSLHNVHVVIREIEEFYSHHTFFWSSLWGCTYTLSVDSIATAVSASDMHLWSISCKNTLPKHYSPEITGTEQQMCVGRLQRDLGHCSSVVRESFLLQLLVSSNASRKNNFVLSLGRRDVEVE